MTIAFICKYSIIHSSVSFGFISFNSCVLQILSLLQDRQSQSTSISSTQLSHDERIVESQALSNLKKAVEKHSGHFFGSRQQVKTKHREKETYLLINVMMDEYDEISVEWTLTHVDTNNVDRLSNQSIIDLYCMAPIHRNV